MTLEHQLALLSLPAGKQRVLMNRVSKKVLSDSKKRIARQTDIDGSAYTKRRKRRKDRKKMLSGLARNLKVVYQSSSEAKLGFSNGLMAYIAAKQQFGATDTFSAASANNGGGANHSGAMASRQQAAKLIAIGYKRGGKKGKRPTIKWLTQNMSSAQAGLILRVLRTAAAKTSWEMTLPARSFLGATEQDATKYVDEIFETILGGLHGTG